jgi:hypothetical protein
MPALEAVVGATSWNPRISHRIDAEEFYRGHEGQVIDSSELLNEKLEEWQETPYERLRQKMTTLGEPKSVS